MKDIRAAEQKAANSYSKAMVENNFEIEGLTASQVLAARAEHGSNTLQYRKKSRILQALKSLAKEPMVILLLIASVIYFVSGNTGDAIFLASAIVLVAAISLYQDTRSHNALKKLKEMTQPWCKVIRDGVVVEIKSDDLVVGDSLMVEEGTLIAADGVIVHSNDFSVNESIVTGESLPVYKDKKKEDKFILRGTTVTGGLAIATVTAIGNGTRLGAIGKSLDDIQEEDTPLETQIGDFVKKMVIAGAFVFLIVWIINYLRSNDVLDSLLKALTLAMSILPEEIPVAFTTFMALGAWRLMKMGVVVKQMKTVETLGSASVICIDKTGTITENKMTLAQLFVVGSKKITTVNDQLSTEEQELVRLAMWASEPIPFDPMEVALHKAYSISTSDDERPAYKMIHEYPLGGKPPMMTHIFENSSGKRIVAAKGAPEALMATSGMSADEKAMIEQTIDIIAADGYRMLGVGEAILSGNSFPENQQDFQFKFIGIVAFYDPPKKHIEKVLEDFYTAGISVKIITGDNAATTNAIARQIGFRGYENCLSGDELMKMDEQELRKIVGSTNVFARMFPDAKLRVIEALKAENEIVAMMGDGVNDGPALKAAHIGIAMGKKGTEIAKQAAALVLVKDDLSKMVDAVAMGRKIYSNLKKAIQYIISIHIPIILTVFTPLAFGWVYPNIFSPVHVIFLELIMGPTCSMIYENEPIEKNTMIQKPRPFVTSFFTGPELFTSILQGLMITAGTISIYQYALAQAYNEVLTRTMVFTVLISANIFLTLINRSFFYSVLTTIKYKNSMIIWMILITIILSGSLIFIRPLADFFSFVPLETNQLLISVLAGFLSTIWYESVKWRKRVAE
jgi:Ca2+-transporting ATPase